MPGLGAFFSQFAIIANFFLKKDSFSLAIYKK